MAALLTCVQASRSEARLCDCSSNHNSQTALSSAARGALRPRSRDDDKSVASPAGLEPAARYPDRHFDWLGLFAVGGSRLSGSELFLALWGGARLLRSLAIDSRPLRRRVQQPGG